MKLIKLSLLLTMSFSFKPLAQGLPYKMNPNGPSSEVIIKAYEIMSPSITLMKNIMGFSTNLCDMNTGKPINKMTATEANLAVFEQCLIIFASTDEAINALSVLYPPGKRLVSPNSLSEIPPVYINTEKHGPMVAR